MVEIKLCLQNVRGLNSKLKQDQLLREIENKNLDFIGLVETRLQRLIGRNNRNITQTQLARNGEVMVMNSGKFEMRTIKTLKQFLTWAILNVGGFPLHMLTVYIPPY
ncbi:hypothetical protein OXYTRIMIC_070 [Oxytricha trifallax]|uniref:Endonuclease-reverse transcriptase n=1 Tax=Oxytricha trifallax TaxID=1172189 RepID=A0A073HZS0_9SPIT|nr:hypothetical protein OXYTRIMIC_070 [Oxytricha trifallax]